MCAVHGRLQARDWQDKDGNKRRSYEVVADQVYFTGSKQESGGGAGGGFAPAYSDKDAPPIDDGYGLPPVSGDDFAELEDDGDLPF